VVATVPQIVPTPAVRSRQGNRTFTLGTLSAATETRTITYDATQGVRISRDPIGEPWFELGRKYVGPNGTEGRKRSRKLQKDPGKKQIVNLYTYVLNNPENMVDSLGLAPGDFDPCKIKYNCSFDINDDGQTFTITLTTMESIVNDEAAGKQCCEEAQITFVKAWDAQAVAGGSTQDCLLEGSLAAELYWGLCIPFML